MMRIRFNRGFTLIELIISVGLFAVVAVIVSAAYLNLVNLNRRTRANEDMINNLAFVLDVMSRAIRTGTGYACSASGGNGTCGSSGTHFSFVDADGCSIQYSLSSGAIVETESGGSGCSTLTAAPLTDSRITISRLNFFVTGVGTGDYFQPQVVISVGGSVPTGPGIPATVFNLQTSATERGIDIP